MQIEKLLKDNPSFHVWSDGRAANFGVSDQVVKYIYGKLKAGDVTLETGSGKSTFAFLLAGCKHTAIAPDPGEELRIRNYCSANQIAADFTFIANSSAEVLPGLAPQLPALDFVFIDGAHRYPYAEIDYHFTEKKLRIGGYMVVDDVHLPSVRNLYVFLKNEKNWKLEALIDKTAFFKKTGEEVLINDWQNQGINRYFLVYSNIKATLIGRVKSLLGIKRS